MVQVSYSGYAAQQAILPKEAIKAELAILPSVPPMQAATSAELSYMQQPRRRHAFLAARFLLGICTTCTDSEA